MRPLFEEESKSLVGIDHSLLQPLPRLQVFFLLKKQGRCIITNANNALNKNTVSEIREMWRERDTSWDYI